MSSKIRLLAWLLSLVALSASAQMVITLGLEGTAGGAPTYLIDQDFEETGLPTESTWSQIAATCDWDESTTVLAGSESLEAVGSTSSRCQVDTAADISELWYYSLYRVDDVTLSNVRHMSIRTLADSEIMYLEMKPSDGIVCVNGVSITEQCWGTAISSDTNYHLWAHYKASSGATDGEAEIGYSTDGSVPFGGDACCTAASTHNVTTNVGRIQLRSQSQNAAAGVFFDNVLIDDEAIGAQ